MHWVKDFYRFQRHLLWDVPFDEWDTKMELLKNKGIKKPASILELGGGAGEFAISAALHGFNVKMIDILEENIQLAEKFKLETNANRVNFEVKDFYTLNEANLYDAVCYWDGFGIGEDEDQIQLLNIIYNALKPKGKAFIDFYPPSFWKQQHGKEFTFDETSGRTYSYHFEDNKMIDCWWINNKETKHCQYLKCYSIKEIEKLIAQTPFKLQSIIPGEKCNPQTFSKQEGNSFEECISNTMVLIKK